MKKVVYNVYGEDKKEYLITDSEFKKAVTEWSQGRPYWCERLQSMLQKNFNFLETPEGHINFDKVLFDPETRQEFGAKVKDGKLEHFLIADMESGERHYIPVDKDTELNKSLPRLIPMDEYFDSEFNKAKAKKIMTDQEYKQLAAGQ